MRCGARRRRGARCLQAKSEESVPGEVRHSLGEPSWRCHPHPLLLLRSLLRHTPASAATRPFLCSAPTCLQHSRHSLCVCIQYTMCVQLNVKMLFYAMKHCHTHTISSTEADDRVRRYRYRKSERHSVSIIKCNFRFMVHLLRPCAYFRQFWWQMRQACSLSHLARLWKQSPFYWTYNAMREARSQLLCTYSPSAWTWTC